MFCCYWDFCISCVTRSFSNVAWHNCRVYHSPAIIAPCSKVLFEDSTLGGDSFKFCKKKTSKSLTLSYWTWVNATVSFTSTKKKKAKSLAAVIAQDIEFCILSQQKKRNKTKHVLRPRIELGTSCVWGTRDNQLHHPSTWIWNCSGRIMLLIINLSLPQYWSFWHFDQPYWRAIAPQKS